jgi:hypothetical protein
MLNTPSSAKVSRFIGSQPDVRDPGSEACFPAPPPFEAADPASVDTARNLLRPPLRTPVVRKAPEMKHPERMETMQGVTSQYDAFGIRGHVDQAFTANAHDQETED